MCCAEKWFVLTFLGPASLAIQDGDAHLTWPAGWGHAAHWEPRSARWRVSERTKMVVFPSQLHFHLFDGCSQCGGGSGHHLHLLPQRGGRVLPSRTEASRRRGQKTETPRSKSRWVKWRPRRWLHVRGQRLGWRAYFGPDWNWTHSCKLIITKVGKVLAVRTINAPLKSTNAGWSVRRCGRRVNRCTFSCYFITWQK